MKNKTTSNEYNTEGYSRFHKWGERNRLKKLARYQKGKVLDIGCADQFNPFLKTAYGTDVYIPKIVPKNYKLYKMDSDNLYSYPFKDEFFDVIIAGEVVEHIPDMGQFLTEMNRILKPGGTLCISTPNPQSPVEIAIHLWTWIKGYDFDKGKVFDHVHEFLTTNMITLLNNYGFKPFGIEGTYIQIPFTKIQINMNIVPLTYQTIYYAHKKR